MHDGGVALHPHPAPAPRQPPVVPAARLALVQHCNHSSMYNNISRLIKIFTCEVREAHGHHVRGVDVLVERLLYEVLGLVPGQGSHPLVQEDQLEVEAAAWTSLVDSRYCRYCH